VRKVSHSAPVTDRPRSHRIALAKAPSSFHSDALHNGNGTLYSLVDQLPVGLAVVTRQGDLLYANHRLLEMLGQPFRHLTTQSNLRFFIESQSWPSLEEAISRGSLEHTRGQITVSGPDDQHRVIQVSLSPFAPITSAVKIVATDPLRSPPPRML